MRSLNSLAGRAGAAIIIFAMLVMVGCEDEQLVAPGSSPLPAEIAALPAGIHPILSIPGMEAGQPQQITRIRLHLFSVGVDETIAGYQGVLRYDPSALEILDGTFSEGVVGAWNVVEPGLLRFAGASLDGIKEIPAIELTVRAHRPPFARDFRVEMEEIVAAKDFVDMTARVDRGAAVIVTGARLGRVTN